MSRRAPPAQRPPAQRAQIHLPPLTAREALLVVNLLDRAIAALWRTHGHAMAELLSNLESAEPTDSSPQPDDEQDPF